MLEAMSILIATLALGVSVVLAIRLQQTQRQVNALLSTLESERLRQTSALVPVNEQTRPLEGLHIVLCIAQDHPHPVFANILREHFFSEDVREVTLLAPVDLNEFKLAWAQKPDAPDILIYGELTCNGYAEIYYQADITCATQSQTLCKVIEKPPHGDRPVNLATGILARLKTELDKVVSQSDRRRALQELKGP